MLRVFSTTSRYVDQCFVPNTKIELDSGLKTAIKQLKMGEGSNAYRTSPTDYQNLVVRGEKSTIVPNLDQQGHRPGHR